MFDVPIIRTPNTDCETLNYEVIRITPMIHKNIRVSGRVQGVYYRASTVDMAKSIGLKGFVLNEPSGSVYMEVEGEEPQVNEIIEWAKKGPPMAKVDSLEISDGPVTGFTSFEIRRQAF